MGASAQACECARSLLQHSRVPRQSRLMQAGLAAFFRLVPRRRVAEKQHDGLWIIVKIHQVFCVASAGSFLAGEEQCTQALGRQQVGTPTRRPIPASVATD